MTPLPKAHQNILALALLIVLVAGGVFFFLLRPKLVSVEEARASQGDIKKKIKDINKNNWPLAEERLRKTLENNKKQIDGINRKLDDGTVFNNGKRAEAERVLKQATSMFDDIITQTYTDGAMFMSRVSRLDYQGEFSELVQRLKARNVILNEKILGIGEETVDIEVYQLMLKIWTLEKAVNAALDNRLFIERTRLGPNKAQPKGNPLGNFLGRRGRFASLVQVMPTQSYVLNKDDEDPYILEFPIRLTVRGSLANVCRLLCDLQNEKQFLALNRFEMNVESPEQAERRKRGPDGVVKIQNVVAVIELSSFFRPYTDAPKVKSKKKLHVPDGA